MGELLSMLLFSPTCICINHEIAGTMSCFLLHACCFRATAGRFWSHRHVATSAGRGLLACACLTSLMVATSLLFATQDKFLRAKKEDALNRMVHLSVYGPFWWGSASLFLVGVGPPLWFFARSFQQSEQSLSSHSGIELALVRPTTG